MRSRHHAREIAFSTLYALDFNKELKIGYEFKDFSTISEEELAKIDDQTKLFARFLVVGTLEHLEEIDNLISQYSINRPIDKIDLIDRNILRISVFSLLYMKNVHQKVVITEAIRLSQEYSRQMNYKFINGILDSMQKELNDNTKNT